jgi:hypothetical protein
MLEEGSKQRGIILESARCQIRFDDAQTILSCVLPPPPTKYYLVFFGCKKEVQHKLVRVFLV